MCGSLQGVSALMYCLKLSQRNWTTLWYEQQSKTRSTYTLKRTEKAFLRREGQTCSRRYRGALAATEIQAKRTLAELNSTRWRCCHFYYPSQGMSTPFPAPHFKTEDSQRESTSNVQNLQENIWKVKTSTCTENQKRLKSFNSLSTILKR